VVTKLPHDRNAFTQGLSVEEDKLYESTGLYRHSSLRQIDPLTGAILRQQSLSPSLFAEGVATFPDVLIQITWKERRAMVYDRSSWKLLHLFLYSGEGWGLCRDGDTVWMSNGSATLTQRDRHTFAILKTLRVTLNGKPIARLNDLECCKDHLYANVWFTDWIIRINKGSGVVTGLIDASSLLSPEEKACLGPEEVLNGIAFRPQRGTFFLTGKNWPWIFEVRLVLR